MTKMARAQAEDRASTIKDVAAAVGLSPATVSRALTNPHLVRSDTRKRVLEAVDRLGYQPNLMARDLRRLRTGVAFVVVPSLSPFYLEVFRGAERAAREVGYAVLMGHTDRDPAREQVFFDEVASRRADGLVLVTSVQSSALAERRRPLPPTVAALEAVDGTDMATVRVDHYAAAIQATEHLIKLGHRRIAHISGPARAAMAQDRRRGYLAALARAGIEPRPELCVQGDFRLDSGTAAMLQLLDQDPRPTAVFAGNDEMAVGAIRAARSRGLSAPEDISVIGFDDQRIARIYQPEVTTIRIPCEELGYQAMLLLHRVMKNQPAEHDMVLPTELLLRETTAPAP